MSQILPQKPQISPKTSTKSQLIQRRIPWLYALWKFSRPHTIIGTTLSVLGLYLIAISGSGEWALGKPFSSLFPLLYPLFPIPYSLFPTLLACLCGNIYIVGLNQLEDVGIDQVNKPHLPLASGEFSRWEAQSIVGVTGISAVLLSLAQGYILFTTVGLSLLIGTAYSLPPLRLKRFPFWASLCIFTVRGIIVNLGLFLHFNQRLHNSTNVPLAVWILTLFILGFTFAIAIFKDIPDIEGDRRYNINTFTIRLGQEAVFNLARWVLTGCYLGMILVGVFIPFVNSGFLILIHLSALLIFWFFSVQVDLQDRGAIASFYQFIWKLFFLEYLIFPAACLLG
jgi:homogentisate phytyltransferase/homogentisate geranylgeranyltransferase